MKQEILFNREAREAVIKGINRVADVVKITLGPKGSGVILVRPNEFPVLTRDGVSVSRRIRANNEVENVGCTEIKKVADKINKLAGDATTAGIVLTQALAVEALEKANSGFDKNELGKGMQEATRLAKLELAKISRPINSRDDIKNVATISAKDPIIGELIAHIIDKVGRDGLVTVEESQGFGLSIDVVQGMKIDKGFISPSMMTEQDKSIFENASILITDKKISTKDEMISIMEKLLIIGKKDLVIIADDIDGEALLTIIFNKFKGLFNCLAIKAPGFGDNKKEILKDIAIITGGEYISQELGTKIEDVNLSQLGKAHRVISTKDSTIIAGGEGDETKIQDRVKLIKKHLNEAETELEKEKLGERLGKLSGGVAIIKVGGITDIERKEEFDRIEDAVRNTKSAIEEGIVVGGEVALARIAKSLQPFIDGLDINNLSFLTGAKIIVEGLKTPLKQIAENAGVSGDVVLENVLNGEGNYGYNVDTGKYEDLIQSGIIDATKSIRVALETSASTAYTLVIAGAIVCDEEEIIKPINN